MAFACWAPSKLFSQALPGLGVGIPGIGVGVGVPINLIADYPNPYANRAPAYRSVYLFKASEFAQLSGQPQAIRSVFFYDSIPQGALLQQFTIRMMEVDWDSMPAVIPDANLQTVYWPKTYVDRKGLNEHVFDVPFCWDGSRNFIVDICVQNLPDDRSYNATIRATIPDSGVYYSYHDWNMTGASICAASEAVQPERFEKRPLTSFANIHGDSIDLRLYSVQSPADLLEINTQNQVSVTFQNYSCPTVTGVKLGYQWNQQPPVIENYPQAVQAGQYLPYTFQTPITTDGTQFSSLKIWVQHPNDRFQQNDTLQFLVFVKDGQFEGLDYTGREFWVAFMHNFDNFNVDQKLFLTSTKNTSAQVALPWLGWSTQVSLTANQVTSVTIPKTIAGVVTATEPSEVISKTGIHIVSNDDISVYGYSGQPMSSDAYLALPRRNLGRKYAVTAPTGIYNPKTVGSILLNAPAEFIVVATEDQTQLVIIPSAPTEKNQQGDTIRATLRKGETFLVKARIDSSSVGIASNTYDLSGSQVISDKKIGVIGGSQCAFVPGITAPDKCQSCDHLLEMLTPPITWGSTFTTTDFEFKTGEDILRVVNSDSLPVVYRVNGQSDTIPAHGFRDKKFSGNILIDADKPIQALQLCTGGQCTLPPTSTDPFVTNLIPEAQWGNYYTFSTTVTPNLSLHYINVVKKHANGRVALDGYRIPDNYFTAVPGSPYWVAKIPVSQGVHKVSGDSSIAVTVYGFGKDNSYGYPASGSFLKVINQPPVVIEGSSTPITCFGAKNGTAAVRASGGTPPYGFYWNDGFVGDQRSNLDTGNYWVFVEDDYGYHDTLFLRIDQPERITHQFTTGNATCFGDANGFISIISNGGVAPFSYTWSDGTQGPNRSNLAAGNYGVQITDANLCPFDTVIPITQPPALSLTLVGTPPACHNDQNGTLLARVNQAVAPCTYRLNGGNGQPDSIFANLASGSYAVEVIDQRGCKAQASFTLTNPPPIQVSITKTDIGCFETGNGTANATASGGYGNFNYTWSTSPTQAGPAASGLNQGWVRLTTTDGRCTRRDSALIDSIPSPQINVVVTPATCDQKNGSALAIITGGQAPYTYFWETSPPVIAPTINNLLPGSYKLFAGDVRCKKRIPFVIENLPGPQFNVITEAARCGENNGKARLDQITTTGNYTVVWNTNPVINNVNQIDQLTPGNYSVDVQDQRCSARKWFAIAAKTPLIFNGFNKILPDCNTNNGSITAMATGGSGPITYEWLTNPSVFGPTLSNLSPGVYRVRVTDGECTIESDVSLSSRNGPSIRLLATNPTCDQPNGSIEALVSGTNGTFAVSWNGNNAINSLRLDSISAGYYSVSIDDGTCIATADTLLPGRPRTAVQLASEPSKCDRNDGEVSATPQGDPGNYQTWWNGIPAGLSLTDLAAGWYTFSLFDGVCYTTDSIEVKSIPKLNITLLQVDSSTCNGSTGKAMVQVSQGSGIYSGYWNTDPIQVGDSAVDLPAGQYTFFVTDFFCYDSLKVDIPNYSRPLFTVGSTPEHCNLADGGADLTLLNPRGTPSVVWGDGNLAFSRSGLRAGWHRFTLSDEYCSLTDSLLIAFSGPPVLSLIGTVPARCDLNNGELNLSCTTPNGPVSLTWEQIPGLTSFTANQLADGNYRIVARDNFCADTLDALVNRIPRPLWTVQTGIQARCNLNNGQATVSPTSGAPPYQIQWLTSQENGFSASQLPSGWNPFTISDTYCSYTDSVLIGRRPIHIVQNLTTTPDWCMKGNGTAQVVASGGSGIFTYQWQPAGIITAGQIGGLRAGNYAVVVSDGDCQIQRSFTIDAGWAPKGRITLVQAEYCDQQNGALQLTDLSSDLTSILWSNQITGVSQLNNLPSGMYTATLSNGQCDTTLIGAVPEIAGPTIIPTSFSDTCGANVGRVQWFTSGGTPPITSYWNGLPQTSPIGQLPVGDNWLRITDIAGCSDSALIQIDNTMLNASRSYLTVNPTDPAIGQRVYIDLALSPPWQLVEWEDELGRYAPNIRHSLTPESASKDYWVMAKLVHPLGCTDSLMATLRAVEDPVIYIPTSFTPNQDGFNDTFFPVALGISRWNGAIYNRWGEPIYVFDDLEDKWDGTYMGRDAKTDVYVLDIVFTSKTGKKIHHNTKVTLLR